MTSSLHHFSAARRALDITQCNDLMSLQALLCIVVFLVSTSRIVAAHPYIGVACSSALRLGLHSRSFEFLSLTDEQRRGRTLTLITILKLDIYSSLVLGLPPFIGLRGISKDLTFSESDVSSSPLFSGKTNHEDTVQMELSLKHLELLKITATGLEAVFPQLAPSTEARSGDGVLLVNIKHLEEAGDRFQVWARSFSSLLRRLGDTSQYET